MTSATTPTLLYIDDDAGLARLVSRGLTRQGFGVEHCDNGEAGIERIKQGGIDVIALDQYMPGLDGLETLEQIQKLPSPPPVVFVTASQDSKIAVTALKAGAADYLVKDTQGDFLPLLHVACTTAIKQALISKAATTPKPKSTHRAIVMLPLQPSARYCCARSITALATHCRSSPRCSICRPTQPAKITSRWR